MIDNHAKLILTCSFQRIIFIYGHRPFMSLQLHSAIELLENCNNNRAACFEVIRFDHMARLTLFVREQLLMEATHRSSVAFIDRSAHPLTDTCLDGHVMPFIIKPIKIFTKSLSGVPSSSGEWNTPRFLASNRPLGTTWNHVRTKALSVNGFVGRHLQVPFHRFQII